MPKLPRDQVPDVKLDGSASYLEISLTDEQRRGLFEYPGKAVYAIVELTSKQYTGHADGEEKAPQVRLRVTAAEAARDDEQAGQVVEVMRAMMRRRKIDGTLDEVGPGPRDAEAAVSQALAAHPTETEYREHVERQHARRGGVEQFG